jgi:hypothetical protein
MADDRFEPKFRKIATIPVVIHVGHGGKKSHLSQADIVECVQTGELCWVPYKTRCGSAKWTRSGKSAETVMQSDGIAQITCQKCGIREVKLNPMGFDMSKMKTMDEVYQKVKTRLLLEGLPQEIQNKAIIIIKDFTRPSCMPQNLKIGGRRAKKWVSAWSDEQPDTPLSILLEIYNGNNITAEVFNSQTHKYEKISIN